MLLRRIFYLLGKKPPKKNQVDSKLTFYWEAQKEKLEVKDFGALIGHQMGFVARIPDNLWKHKNSTFTHMCVRVAEID